MTSDIESTNLCERAALYSLGALGRADERQFESHLLDGCATCAHELSDAGEIVALLAFAADPADPSPILKDRVLDSIGRAGESPRSHELPAHGDGWEPYRVPGVQVRTLHMDPVAREHVMLVRAGPGVRYPTHRHAALEEMFMLEGELDFEGLVYRAGDYIRSTAGSIHASSETRTGCMFLLRGSLDNEMIY